MRQTPPFGIVCLISCMVAFAPASAPGGEFVRDLPEKAQIKGQNILRQTHQCSGDQILRHSIKGLCDAAGDAGDGVAVATQRNSSSQSVLVVRALQKCRDGFRYGFLTALYMMVGRADVVAAAVQVVMEGLLNMLPDLLLAVTGTRQKDGNCG